MSEQKVAISTHPIFTHPPRLSAGKILPKAVVSFEFHCENYFANARGGVTDDAKVARILSSFDDLLVNDWIRVNRDRLITLTFEQFMSEFRTRWLPYNWEHQLLSQIMGSRFDPKKTRFGPWAEQVQTLNVYLRGTPLRLDNRSMRLLLQTNLDEDLQSLVWLANANEITELHHWVTKVESLDDRRRKEAKRMWEVYNQVTNAHQK